MSVSRPKSCHIGRVDVANNARVGISRAHIKITLSEQHIEDAEVHFLQVWHGYQSTSRELYRQYVIAEQPGYCAFSVIHCVSRLDLAWGGG